MVEVECCISREILDVIEEGCRRRREFACCPNKLVTVSMSNLDRASANALSFDGTHTVATSMLRFAARRNNVCRG